MARSDQSPGTSRPPAGERPDIFVFPRLARIRIDQFNRRGEEWVLHRRINVIACPPLACPSSLCMAIERAWRGGAAGTQVMFAGNLAQDARRCGMQEIASLWSSSPADHTRCVLQLLDAAVPDDSLVFAPEVFARMDDRAMAEVEKAMASNSRSQVMLFLTVPCFMRWRGPADSMWEMDEGLTGAVRARNSW